MAALKVDGLLGAPTPPGGNRVLVVGAGIAGASVAHALATQGQQVTVLEAGNAPAQGASGHTRAVIRPFLARSGTDPLAQFYSQASRFACQFVASLPPATQQQLQIVQGAHWEHSAAEELNALGNRVIVLDANQASIRSGTAVAAGLWLHDAITLSPAVLCRVLMSHENIRFRSEAKVGRMQRIDGEWHTYTDDDTLLAKAPCAVISTGPALDQLAPNVTRDLHKTHGLSIDTTELQDANPLKAAVLGRLTLAPAHRALVISGGHWKSPLSLTEAQAAFRLPQAMQSTVPKTQQLSTRLHSPDRLPIAGGVPDVTTTLNRFEPLTRGRLPTQPAEYQPGLYVIGALGGRGITSALWVAHCLAQVIVGKCATLPTVHPLRFLVRALRRNQAY